MTITRTKELRMPDLHLPEMTRDDIARVVSDIRLPDVDLQKLDVGKAVAGVAAAAGIARPSDRRPRWPIAVAVVTMGLIGLAVLRSPGVRERITQAMSAARDRLADVRGSMTTTEIDPSDIAAPVAAPAWSDSQVSIDVPTADPIDTRELVGTNGSKVR